MVILYQNLQRTKEMISFHDGVWIVRLPIIVVRLLGRLPFARETALTDRQSIRTHAHQFTALYFVEGVAMLEVVDSMIILPRAAAVIVWRGTEHGWTGVQRGMQLALVRHFHAGHGAHSVQEPSLQL